MRTLPSNFKSSIQNDIDPDVKVFLCELRHRSLVDADGNPDPIYVCSHALERVEETDEAVHYGVRVIRESGEITYEYAGFTIELGTDEAGVIPSVELSLPFASREIIEKIEMLDNSPMTVRIDMVLAEDPQSIIMTLADFQLTEISYDDSAITGTVSRDLLFNEPVPQRRMTPTLFPFLGW